MNGTTQLAIAQTLCESIVSCVLEPGQRLVAAQIAQWDTAHHAATGAALRMKDSIPLVSPFRVGFDAGAV